mmetsp:Transcript_142499/g.455509  ORF Transcript_142499/g.455509 Transcript_142499/m.455509 type:complete len:309 (-) Transcript_142499:149-1075(-)
MFDECVTLYDIRSRKSGSSTRCNHSKETMLRNSKIFKSLRPLQASIAKATLCRFLVATVSHSRKACTTSRQEIANFPCLCTSDVFETVHATTAAVLRGGSDRPNLDVRESDVRLWERAAQVLGFARCAARARPALDARPVGKLVSEIGRIQPEHADVGVVPERQHQHHATVKSFAHLLQGALCGEGVQISELGLLLAAELVCDGVACTGAQDRRLRVLGNLAVLHVETLDLRKVASVGAVVRQKMGHDRHGLRGVDSEVGALAIEALRARSVGVEIAAILVTHARVALALGCLAADRTFAFSRAALTA